MALLWPVSTHPYALPVISGGRCPNKRPHSLGYTLTPVIPQFNPVLLRFIVGTTFKHNLCSFQSFAAIFY